MTFEWPLSICCRWTADSCPEKLALFYMEPSLKSSCCASPWCSSVHSPPYWTVYTTLLWFCPGGLSPGWTNVCLRVLPGLKWTPMWCLSKILFSFPETPSSRERWCFFLLISQTGLRLGGWGGGWWAGVDISPLGVAAVASQWLRPSVDLRGWRRPSSTHRLKRWGGASWWKPSHSSQRLVSVVSPSVSRDVAPAMGWC